MTTRTQKGQGMDNKKIARELLQVAKGLLELAEPSQRRAGLLLPPPTMATAIIAWAEASLAANHYVIAKEDLVIYLGIPNSEKRIKELKIEIEEMSEKMKQYPGVTPKKFKRISKKFKIDLSGWKYQNLLKNVDQKVLEELNQPITVELSTSQGNSGGFFDKSKNLIRLSESPITGVNGIGSLVAHELTHWTQHYMNAALGITDFGRLSPKLRNPDVKQSPSIIKKQELKEKGIDPKDFHDLDDGEFYTELMDVYESFKREYKDEDSEKNKLNALKEYVNQNRFFQTLKRNNMGKWNKAVSELYKLVMRRK